MGLVSQITHHQTTEKIANIGLTFQPGSDQFKTWGLHLTSKLNTAFAPRLCHEAFLNAYDMIHAPQKRMSGQWSYAVSTRGLIMRHGLMHHGNHGHLLLDKCRIYPAVLSSGIEAQERRSTLETLNDWIRLEGYAWKDISGEGIDTLDQRNVVKGVFLVAH